MSVALGVRGTTTGGRGSMARGGRSPTQRAPVRALELLVVGLLDVREVPAHRPARPLGVAAPGVLAGELVVRLGDGESSSAAAGGVLVRLARAGGAVAG